LSTFDIKYPIWQTTTTTSTPFVPLQAGLFALAGLRLFADFFQPKINKPRAIQARGFLLTRTDELTIKKRMIERETK
jgi:hypothetical protein